MALHVLNLMTNETNNDYRIRRYTLGSVATAVIEPPSAMHLVGRKARRRSLAVEPHSGIVQVAMLVRRIRLETGQRFVMPAVELLRPRVPTGIEQRFDLRVATA